MKVYLDDVRQAPEGWVLVKTPKEMIDLISKNKVDIISLDHDLGDDKNIGTGYDVLLYIEEALYTNKEDIFLPFGVPKILLHTANPVARKRMAVITNKINNKEI